MSVPTIICAPCDPPPTARGARGAWVEALAPITRRPDQWHLVARWDNPRGANSLAARIKGGATSVPPGQWDFTCRADADSSELYARYRRPAFIPNDTAGAVRCVAMQVVDGTGDLS